MARWILAVLATILLSHGVAWSHSARPPQDVSGIPIPFVTHGEMAVLAPYRAEILALAERVRQPDTDLWSLVRYAGIQRAECLWGLAPGSLTDEESPFNECSHAELAAIKAILFKLRDMPEATAEASGLVSRIDAEMTLKGAAFIGCQYSGEGFNTASFVRPRWNALPHHLPSLLFVVLALTGLPAIAFGLSRLAALFSPQVGGDGIPSR